jgi:hypothetical protein
MVGTMYQILIEGWHKLDVDLRSCYSSVDIALQRLRSNYADMVASCHIHDTFHEKSNEPNWVVEFWQILQATYVYISEYCREGQAEKRAL